MANELINDIQLDLYENNCKMTDRYEVMINTISNVALTIAKEYKGKVIKSTWDMDANLKYKLFVVSTLVTFCADIKSFTMFYKNMLRILYYLMGCLDILKQ